MLTIFGAVRPERIGEISTVDIVVTACGFETRSRDLASVVEFTGAKMHALAFEHSHELAFDENRSFYEAKNYAIHELPDDQIQPWLFRELAECQHSKPGLEVSIFIDISSQSRSRLGRLVEAVSRAGETSPVRVFFGYSLAAFSAPSAMPSPTVSLGPISAFFAGWATDPDLPMTMLIGLGYEQDRAVGAVEYLEPSSVWALIPKSDIQEYDAYLLAANASLLAQVEPSKRLVYPVDDPNATLALLSPLVQRLGVASSVMLLPSGPKILVLLSLLIACSNKNISVWRASADHREVPVDRVASGQRMYVECLFLGG